MRTYKKNLRETRESKGMQLIKFDVMMDDIYIATLRYRHCPLFPLTEEEMREFVENEIPSLKGKKWRIAF